MLNTDQLFDLAKTGLKYTVSKIIQGDDGLLFTVKMEHGMKKVKTEDTHEVLEFRSITGGKGGEDNWLERQDVGTVFLSKDNKMGLCMLSQFHVKSKYEKATLLFSNFPEREFHVFVDTAHFSRDNELVEVLKKGTDDDGNSR